jgi:hypothetical protein
MSVEALQELRRSASQAKLRRVELPTTAPQEEDSGATSLLDMSAFSDATIQGTLPPTAAVAVRQDAMSARERNFATTTAPVDASEVERLVMQLGGQPFERAKPSQAPTRKVLADDPRTLRGDMSEVLERLRERGEFTDTDKLSEEDRANYEAFARELAESLSQDSGDHTHDEEEALYPEPHTAPQPKVAHAPQTGPHAPYAPHAGPHAPYALQEPPTQEGLFKRLGLPEASGEATHLAPPSLDDVASREIRGALRARMTEPQPRQPASTIPMPPASLEAPPTYEMTTEGGFRPGDMALPPPPPPLLSRGRATERAPSVGSAPDAAPRMAQGAPSGRWKVAAILGGLLFLGLLLGVGAAVAWKLWGG